MYYKSTVSVIAALLLSGCATLDKAKWADELNYELAILKKKMANFEKEKSEEAGRLKAENELELKRLRDEKDQEIERLRQQKQLEVKKVKESKMKEVSDLEKAKQELEKSLQEELNSYKAKLEMTERGLVITFVSEVFFDSGKDVIKTEGAGTLSKVAEVLNSDVPEAKVAVEGHTDNDPIRSSGWKSNWELSAARSLAVVHYFIDHVAVTPERLSAVGYGEYMPVKSNETVQGRKENRRVEIVILPTNLQKVGK